MLHILVLGAYGTVLVNMCYAIFLSYMRRYPKRRDYSFLTEQGRVQDFWKGGLFIDAL